MNRRRLLRFLGLPTLLLGTGGGFATWRAGANPYYEGPVSDHFDGLRFHVPGGPVPRGFGDFLRWQWQGNGESWPDSVPVAKDKPPRRLPGTGFRLAYVGHASFLVQTAGLNLLIDPHWSPRAGPLIFGPPRVTEPGIDFDDLPPIDVVLITHNHYDHLDMPTLARLAARDKPRLITPLGNDLLVREGAPGARVEAHDWGARVALSEQVAAHLEPAYHWSARGLLDRRMALWASFVLEGPAGKIYHVGDTAWGDGAIFRRAREKHGGFALAVLPIGAYEPRWFMRDNHVNPEEAVAILEACGAERALAHHWGTFKLTNEGREEPVRALAAALAARGVAPERFAVPRPGEVVGS